MSSELEDVRHQLAALTARVDAIEGLRAMMDRDLTDIKPRMDAQDHLLQALHITQANHTQTEFGGKLDTIVAMLDRLTPPGDGQA